MLLILRRTLKPLHSLSQATCHVYIDGDGCGIECLPVGGHDLEEAGGAKAEAGGPELRNCTVHHPAPRFAPVEVLRRDGEGDQAPRYTAPPYGRYQIFSTTVWKYLIN